MTSLAPSRREDITATIAAQLGRTRGVAVVPPDPWMRAEMRNYVIVVLDFELCGADGYEILHNLHLSLGMRRADVRLVARLVWEELAAQRLALRMGADAITYGPVDVAAIVELLSTEAHYS